MSDATALNRRIKQTMTLRYVPYLFSKKYFVEKKIGTVLLSVTNTLKSVIISNASVPIYRDIEE
jgi:hypothetical protein